MELANNAAVQTAGDDAGFPKSQLDTGTMVMKRHSFTTDAIKMFVVKGILCVYICVGKWRKRGPY